MHPEIAMFKDPTDVQRAERDQEAESARINAAVEAAEKAITALVARQLDPTAIRSECSAIRDKTILEIRDVRHNVVNRAITAKATERWMLEKWLSEVHDANILHQFTADLQKVATRDLVDYLRYLIQVGDLARIQSVNAVFAARADNRRYKAGFDKILGQFTLSQCGTIGACIANICDLADSVDLKITHLFSAHYISNQSCLPVSQPLPRLEGPSIAAPENERVCRVSSSDALSSPST
jgi:hypothetical protein